MILTDDSLQYFVDEALTEKKGEHKLFPNSIVDEAGTKYGFQNELVFSIRCNDDHLTLQALDESEKKKWMSSIDMKPNWMII